MSYTLKYKKGSISGRKRIGRGNATGQGRTAGKGHNGYKARSGTKAKFSICTSFPLQSCPSQSA